MEETDTEKGRGGKKSALTLWERAMAKGTFYPLIRISYDSTVRNVT